VHDTCPEIGTRAGHGFGTCPVHRTCPKSVFDTYPHGGLDERVMFLRLAGK
jgi:hypothetical protein